MKRFTIRHLMLAILIFACLFAWTRTHVRFYSGGPFRGMYILTFHIELRKEFPAPVPVPWPSPQ